MTTPPTGMRTGRRQTTISRRVAIELLVLTVAFSLFLGVGLDQAWTLRMRRHLDDRLREIALDLSRRTAPAESGAPPLAGYLLPEVVGGPVLLVVRGPDGGVLEIHPTGATPPSFTTPLRPGPEFATVEAAELAPWMGRGSLRLVTVQTPGGFVQAGTNPARLVAMEALTRGTLLLAFPVLTGMVSLAAWLVAGRRLVRLKQIAKIAAQIGPGHLHMRLQTVGERDEFVQLGEEVNLMLSRLEAGFAAQERFISEVAHELKTPVSVLLLEAQVLARSDPDLVAHARFVASVEDEMRRLSKLIESFLTLARARHGRAQVRRVEVDMNDAALEAGEHCFTFARLRDVHLSATLVSADDQAAAPVVAGDPELLRTMIENLLRNAIAVSPRESTIDLRVDCVDHRVAVRVRDRGPGVPADMADRLFERFVTSDHGKSGIKGSGLGLAIARGIAQVHGGSIHFRNLPGAAGGGAEFSVEIPRLQETPGVSR